jgi:rhomboid protease GluP
MKLRPEDPMRRRATDNGVEDGWRGARIGAEVRDRARREMLRVRAEVDIGEPERPLVTLAFLAAAIVVTFVEFATYGASPTTSELSRAGGAGIGVIATGAWWKLLTANLLHANLAHVAMNAFVLFLMGRWLEHLVGRGLVLATMLWAAMLTNVGALLIDVPSVGIGASGVAFGLIGCAVAVDPRARTAAGVIARQLALLNLITTFLIPGISIGGHLGGFLAGLVIGWLGWRRRPTEAQPAGQRRRAASVIAVVLALPPIVLLAIGPSMLPGEALDARGAIERGLLSRQLSGATLDTGLEIDHADCDWTGGDPLDYACELDGADANVRFSERDDQWSLHLGQ